MAVLAPAAAPGAARGGGRAACKTVARPSPLPRSFPRRRVRSARRAPSAPFRSARPGQTHAAGGVPQETAVRAAGREMIRRT